jgi:hypothetical protein
VANTLAYNDTATITAIKSFIVQALGLTRKYCIRGKMQAPSLFCITVSDKEKSFQTLKPEHREIHALITYKGGFICSLGSGYDLINFLTIFNKTSILF